MNRRFEIVSYVGAKPLLFGMSQSQAENLVGPPRSVTLNMLGEKDASYDSYSVRYSPQSGELVEIGFSSEANVVIHGLDLFREGDAFSKLLGEDSCPYEYVGFVVLLDLGITLTGFHDDDPFQRAVTAFPRGRWDHLKSKLKKLSLW